jgi:hypothetical protein
MNKLTENFAAHAAHSQKSFSAALKSISPPFPSLCVLRDLCVQNPNPFHPRPPVGLSAVASAKAEASVK